jgi:hypothetical protein
MSNQWQQTENGKRWIEDQFYSIAEELGISFDGAPRWGNDGPRFRLTVEVAGKLDTLDLQRPEIDDSQGGSSAATRGVRQRLQNHVRKFLQSFAPAKKRIDF